MSARYKCLVVTDTGQVFRWGADNIEQLLEDLKVAIKKITQVIEEGGTTQHIVHIAIDKNGN